MTKIPYLRRSPDGVYYFRRRVPKDVVDVIDKKEIIKSLGTKDCKEAKKRLNVMVVKWDENFELARAGLTDNPAPSPQTSITRDQAIELVRDYVEISDYQLEAKNHQRLSYTPEERRELEIKLEMDLQGLREPDDPMYFSLIWRTAKEIITGANADLEALKIKTAEFLEHVRRGLLEACALWRF